MLYTNVPSRGAVVYVFDVTVLSVGRLVRVSAKRQFSVFVRLQGQGMRTTWIKGKDEHIDYNERFRYRYLPATATGNQASSQKDLFVEVWYRSIFSSGCVSIAWLDVQQLTLVRGVPQRVVLNGVFEDKAASVTLLLTAVNFSQQSGRIVDNVVVAPPSAAAGHAASGRHRSRRQNGDGGDDAYNAQQQQPPPPQQQQQYMQPPPAPPAAPAAPVMGIPLIAQPLPAAAYTTAEYTPAALPAMQLRDDDAGGGGGRRCTVDGDDAATPPAWAQAHGACTAAPLPPPPRQSTTNAGAQPLSSIDLPPPAYPPELFDSPPSTPRR